MKVLFLGTPKFSRIVLEKLVENRVDIVGVITQPDRPSGRGNKIVFSETKKFALEHNIKVYQFEKIKNSIEDIKNIDFDLSITASFGQILPEAFLALAPCINVHPSLLPKYRGSTPIQSAILNGDSITGVTIMKTVKEVDAGDIILQEEMKISPSDTYATLHDKLAMLGGELCNKAILMFQKNIVKFTPQNSKNATFCAQIKSEDGYLDFNKSAEELVNKIRAYSGYIPTYFFVGGEKIFACSASFVDTSNLKAVGDIIAKAKHFLIQTGDGVIEINRLKLVGGKEMDFSNFSNGHKLKADKVDLWHFQI